MMKNKIVLFSSNQEYVGVPLALLEITKMLDTKKYDIHIITGTEYDDYENEILKHCENALCFGVSCITGTPIKEAIKMSQLVKGKYPDLPILWGGWQAITLPDDTLSPPYVDYICTGQGERTFSEFIKMVETNDYDNIGNIKGLSYKKDGVNIHNEKQDPENLNNFPEVNLDLINWEKYLEVTDFGSKVLRVVTSYGCPYRCAFCCEVYNSNRKWAPLSADRVISFLKKLRSRVDFDGITIVDDIFFINEKRVIDIFNGLIDNNFDIKIGQVNGRTDNLVKYKESTWELLKKAGLYNILIGAESGSSETLELINKDATVENTYDVARICKKYEIKLVVSTVIGFPTSSYINGNPHAAFESEFKEITKLYKDLFELDHGNHLLTFSYTPLPYSPLYSKALELGFIPPKNLEGWSNYQLSENHIDWVSNKAIKKIELLNYLSMVISIDFQHLYKKLPFILTLPTKPIISTLKSISKFRLKNNFLQFPLDTYVLMFGIYSFKKMNRVFRFVNIGN
jgi:anaerobic magnesium-protoporphyrin IX monomethyl ester cyclase